MNTFCFDTLTWDNKVRKSFIEELDRRGYDLETLHFSIKRKVPDNEK